MSNYNNKNPVWGNKTTMNQTNTMQSQLGGLGNLNHSGMVPFQQQQVFQNMGLNQQNLGLGLQQMAANQINLASNPLFQQQLTAVTYPNARGLNPTAFQSPTASVNVNNSGTGTKQRVFTGTVSQIHDNFGFIDDEVFFPRNSVVAGSNPKVGDKVLVEATFSASMPFKWNATRVQSLQSTNNNHPRESRDSSRSERDRSSVYAAVPPPEGFSRRGEMDRDRPGDRGKTIAERRARSRDRDDAELERERKRRREDRVREREKDEKDRKSPIRRRSRTRSPKARRRTRIIPRYNVQIPKIPLDLSQADVLEVKRRYSTLYIPSDFFHTYVRWVDAFPPNKPYTLNKPCTFHIMHKELDPVIENDAVLEPVDADYRFSAKVMLMSVPGIEEIYQKSCEMAENRDKRDRDSEDRDFVHPTRLINFLVGLRGKNETMAIGGPWSPSLDGENPEKDPSVLIKTAIRTCKALTGIDLSNCTQWYRFVELYYRRSETTHKGKLIPARVETVVLFLPDVWSCLPTRLEWETLQQSYRKHLDKILNNTAKDKEEEEEEDGSGSGDDDEKESSEKTKATHYSQLEPKTMLVADLRSELVARSLPSTGLKSQLVARLSKVLKIEAEKQEEEVQEKEEKEEPQEEEKDKKSEPEDAKLDEQQKRRLVKQYTLPEQPHLIAHPSKTAKSGKFHCTIMSLSLLLDYRPEDTKEHSFEVSLFAELFNEMLMRDFGFNIFKTLNEMPEKPKEKEDEKKKKDDKKSDDKKKDKRDDEKLDDKDKKSEERETKKDKDDDDKRKDRDAKKDDRKSDSSDDDDEDDDRKDRKDKDRKKKDRPKLYTKNKQLLLSFVYFDQTRCGYIFEKDLEELLYALGLNLSRSQAKKLITKVIGRDSLHYRKLTDKPKDEDTEKGENGEKAAAVNVVNVDELAVGNKRLLPIFQNVEGPLNSPRTKTGKASVSSDGLVVYQGAVVDIGKLLSQLDRSEKARIDTEQHLGDLKTENHKLSEKYSKSNSTIKHLNSEVKEYRDKLRSTEDALGRSNAHSKLFQTTLMDIRDKIEPVLKTTSHKDKEDRKDRDRDSDRKKEKDDKSRWEKDRENSKRESDKERDSKKEQDAKKEHKEESKREKEETKKEVKNEKSETDSQASDDVEMKEEKSV